MDALRLHVLLKMRNQYMAYIFENPAELILAKSDTLSNVKDLEAYYN